MSELLFQCFVIYYIYSVIICIYTVLYCRCLLVLMNPQGPGPAK